MGLQIGLVLVSNRFVVQHKLVPVQIFAKFIFTPRNTIRGIRYRSERIFRSIGDTNVTILSELILHEGRGRLCPLAIYMKR
jgi:hypothetical protein